MIFFRITNVWRKGCELNLRDVRRKHQKEVILSRKLTLLTILTLALCATASADILYTTLGPNGEYDTMDGYFVDGSHYNNQLIAMPFTPSSNATMTDAVLALGYYQGNNTPLNVYLFSDSNGLPGTELATLTQQGTIQPFSGGGSLIQFDCNGCGTIDSGTKYWLVAWEADPDAQQVWMYDFNDHSGTFAINHVGNIDGPWGLISGALTGFRIEGTTPEPSTITLFGGGLLMAAAGIRRKFDL